MTATRIKELLEDLEDALLTLPSVVKRLSGGFGIGKKVFVRVDYSHSKNGWIDVLVTSKTRLRIALRPEVP